MQFNKQNLPSKHYFFLRHALLSIEIINLVNFNKIKFLKVGKFFFKKKKALLF